MKPLFRIQPMSAVMDPELELQLRKQKEAIEDGGRRLESIEILDGHRLKDQVIPATTNTAISHKLGRDLIGWIVTDQNAAAHIHKISSDSKTLTLYASAAVTVDLWVF